MWATLRSDLKEFVSTVTDDTSHVLEAIDSKMQEAEDLAAEADRGMEEGAVYSEDGNVITESDFESTGVVSSARDERLHRMGDPETFLEPLIPEEDEECDNEEDNENDDYKEEREFLEAFDLESKTDEIAKLLEEHPDTLKVVFEELVPTRVKYDEFWQRFYFRCNEERIEKEWALEQQRAREARAKALQGGIASVKNLFGGAVQAVSKSLEGGGTDVAVPESPYQFNASQQQQHMDASGISTALFGAGGRPPFVMNTAVSEEDDDEEEEDEEEELGWDDDDDEFDSDEEEEAEESYEEGDTEEQIEFSATLKEEMEQLKQELAQAIEERDQLHQTVEMQSKAIADLQQAEGAPPSATSGDAESKEVEKLKMALFEKDSELAALKASLDDTHEDDKKDSAKKDAAKIAAIERDVERLTQELSKKESEFEQQEEQLKSCTAESEQLRLQSQADKGALEELRSQSQADKTALAESEAAKTELEARLASLEEALQQAETQRTEAEGGAASQISSAQEEAATAQANVASLTSEVEELKGNLEFTTRRADHLEEELASVRKELEQKEVAKPAEKVLTMSPVSSASSGVKVPPLDAHAGGGMDAVNDDDDDAWGDDWSDDDDAWGDDWSDDDE